MEHQRLRGGLHYGAREKNKDKYTIEDIAIESVGIDECDKGFDSACQKVKRILARIKEFIGEPNFIVTEKFKPIIVRIVKKFYLNEDGMNNYTGMNNNKLDLNRNGDSGGEYEIWSKLSFIDTIADMPPNSKEPFQNESQEFKDNVNKIVEQVYNDMTFLSLFVTDPDKKMELIKEYLNDIIDRDQSGFTGDWRLEIWQINKQKLNAIIETSNDHKLRLKSKKTE